MHLNAFSSAEVIKELYINVYVTTIAPQVPQRRQKMQIIVHLMSILSSLPILKQYGRHNELFPCFK